MKYISMTMTTDDLRLMREAAEFYGNFLFRSRVFHNSVSIPYHMRKSCQGIAAKRGTKHQQLVSLRKQLNSIKG